MKFDPTPDESEHLAEDISRRAALLITSVQGFIRDMLADTTDATTTIQVMPRILYILDEALPGLKAHHNNLNLYPALLAWPNAREAEARAAFIEALAATCPTYDPATDTAALQWLLFQYEAEADEVALSIMRDALLNTVSLDAHIGYSRPEGGPAFTIHLDEPVTVKAASKADVVAAMKAAGYAYAEFGTGADGQPIGMSEAPVFREPHTGQVWAYTAYQRLDWYSAALAGGRQEAHFRRVDADETDTTGWHVARAATARLIDEVHRTTPTRPDELLTLAALTLGRIVNTPNLAAPIQADERPTIRRAALLLALTLDEHAPHHRPTLRKLAAAFLDVVALDEGMSNE